MANDLPLLYVTSFGGFSIAVRDPDNPKSDAPVITDSLGHSRKLWILLEYLLFSGKGCVPADELIELLWPDENAPGDPLSSLRLLVHRARQELNRLGCYKGSDLLLGGNGGYSWNRELPLAMDTERFEMFCRNSTDGSAPRQLDAMLSAISLYKGRFLPRAGHQQWAMSLDTYYHSKYTALCISAVELLRSLGRPQDIIEICTRAVVLDPYTEQLHIALIEALSSAGYYSEAMAHYRHVMDMFFKDIGIQPSEKLTAVYRLLSQNVHPPEADIGAIRDSLADGSPNGAFRCEYEMFKQIYNLKLRECRRNGQLVQLARITVFPGACKNPGALS